MDHSVSPFSLHSLIAKICPYLKGLEHIPVVSTIVVVMFSGAPIVIAGSTG